MTTKNYSFCCVANILRLEFFFCCLPCFMAGLTVWNIAADEIMNFLLTLQGELE